MSPTSYRAAPPRGVQRNIPDPEPAVNTTTPRRRLSARQGHRLAGLLARDGGGARGPARGGLVHELSDLLALRALRRRLLAPRRPYVLVVARRLDILVTRGGDRSATRPLPRANRHDRRGKAYRCNETTCPRRARLRRARA